MTGSPSSFEKGARCGSGKMSSTASEGRQSFTPTGVTTIGRLIRIGWAIMASRSWSSVRLGSEPELRVGRALLADDVAHRHAHPIDQLLQQNAVGGVFRYSMMWGSIPALRISPSVLRDVPQSGLW